MGPPIRHVLRHDVAWRDIDSKTLSNRRNSLTMFTDATHPSSCRRLLLRFSQDKPATRPRQGEQKAITAVVTRDSRKKKNEGFLYHGMNSRLTSLPTNVHRHHVLKVDDF